ncbi:MAG: hypothetical protein VR64_21535 [Desulfatitalea sp. BRH_c12]|nr:MAG: hypothetical protein VR64_21535 [Desulfatitalea sp. BRH_c12]
MLKEDTYSDASAIVLNRYFLKERFEQNPDEVLSFLHNIACKDERRDLLYALSELSYLIGEKKRTGFDYDYPEQAARPYYLSSAVYAYFFLLGDRGELPSPYDRRFRVACDLYNTALAHGLDISENKPEEFEPGVRQLPVGAISIAIDNSNFPYELKTIQKFVAADELDVTGLSVRDRRPGLGAPFIAVERRAENAPVGREYPGTLFLRVSGDIRDIQEGTCLARMELYSSYDQNEITVNGLKIPLEEDLTAQLAHSLNQPFIWKLGKLQFLTGREFLENGVYPLQPYSPGRIPVVFVHGTFSSPVWWAEMFNTLRSDSDLRKRYQFWFYIYDSGKPIPFSAVHLRESLSETLTNLDPESKDPALQQMVIVGHSQGGLLTKLTAVNTSDGIVQAATHKRMQELELTQAERETINRYLVYEALPFVKRVVFISTPHRGSYLAKDYVVRLVKKIVTLPLNLLQATTQFFTLTAKFGKGKGMPGEEGHIRTSLDSMSPKNPGLLALAEMPLAPGIKGHSIIAIKGDETPPEGHDGVVAYKSAHVTYLASEFIVRSEHSCQGHPLAIEEVRRILMVHLNENAEQDNESTSRD